MDRKEKEPIYPEVIEEKSGQERQKKDLQTRADNPVAGTYSKPSRLPILNKFNKKRIDSFTEVVKAESSLMEALRDHSNTKARLRDIDVEIQTEKLERRKKLQEAQLGAKLAEELAEQKVKIEKLRLDAEMVELEEKIKSIKQPEAEETPKTRAEERQEELIRIKEEAEHRKDIQFTKQGVQLDSTLRIEREREEELRQCDEDFKQNYGARDISDLSNEALEKWRARRRDINIHFDKMGMKS